ncbi:MULTISPECIES: tRNA (adenosine(37)-N6)-threonylcarbamoyltransferase complex ATPase subunit type 1 TsaE [unclassified Methylophaga]|uniref:tRNA (adenosine(37)-N6)-threonylcarbamoyltransferase complex ATPase subunit type 1 TsaE n=1 Tax=unclassified Methylophaga TaxID=2629249 RepID=UPI00259CEE22|nr:MULTISPECIES: tRNA (adenosine(37)-N6)-threonylcarbamoyltransferase complex ATPase subunit type 1 TsaE [unclassified Methylophaga]
MHRYLDNEKATISLGRDLAMLMPDKLFTIHLEGELGAGKTTFTRGFVQALGHQGNVKSPTYTLVEHYQLDHRDIYHFDLYRLSDPGELEFMGIDDYFHNNAISLIEWAQRGQDFLPAPDLMIHLSYQSTGRQVDIQAMTALGEEVCGKLHK